MLHNRASQERDKLNAMLTVGGDLHGLLSRVLSAQLGGTGIVGKFIQRADELWSGPAGAALMLEAFDAKLSKGAQRFVQWVEESVQCRFGGSRKRPRNIHRLQTKQPEPCMICLTAPAITRASSPGGLLEPKPMYCSSTESTINEYLIRQGGIPQAKHMSLSLDPLLMSLAPVPRPR